MAPFLHLFQHPKLWVVIYTREQSLRPAAGFEVVEESLAGPRLRLFQNSIHLIRSASTVTKNKASICMKTTSDE